MNVLYIKVKNIKNEKSKNDIEKNKSGNGFWENIGFTIREDLLYRNKNIHELKRIDT